MEPHKKLQNWNKNFANTGLAQQGFEQPDPVRGFGYR